LDLQKVLPGIESWLESNQQLRRQVKNLAFGWLKQGIRPRCITRDLTWGIPVPIEGYKAKVLYVWFENVIGYISATVELLGDEGYALWKDKSVKTYHFLAKDNIAFHTIFWPGELIGVGEYVLPYNVVGLQYLTVEGQKFSKSKNIGIFSDDAIESGLPADYWRFYLTYLIPETTDTNFAVAEFQERVNSELIGKFGNLVHRTLSLIWNKWQGQVPPLTTRDSNFEEKVIAGSRKTCGSYERCELRQALQEILRLCDLGNEYINHAAPWKTGDANSIAYVLELGRLCSILLSPIIPTKAQEVLRLLNTEKRSLELSCEARPIPKPEPIFPRIETAALEVFRRDI
jgi:methionyl-tRNA synthetase